MTIKDCKNCGGTHYGSIVCPYLETAKPEDAVAIVPEKPQGDQIDRWGLLKQENARLRTALQGLVDALSADDQDGLTEFAPQMQAARVALGAPDEAEECPECGRTDSHTHTF